MNDETLDIKCHERFGLSLRLILDNLPAEEYTSDNNTKYKMSGLLLYLEHIEKPFDEQGDGYYHEHLGDAHNDFSLMNDIVKVMRHCKQ